MVNASKKLLFFSILISLQLTCTQYSIAEDDPPTTFTSIKMTPDLEKALNEMYDKNDRSKFVPGGNLQPFYDAYIDSRKKTGANLYSQDGYKVLVWDDKRTETFKEYKYGGQTLLKPIDIAFDFKNFVKNGAPPQIGYLSENEISKDEKKGYQQIKSLVLIENALDKLEPSSGFGSLQQGVDAPIVCPAIIVEATPGAAIGDSVAEIGKQAAKKVKDAAEMGAGDKDPCKKNSPEPGEGSDYIKAEYTMDIKPGATSIPITTTFSRADGKPIDLTNGFSVAMNNLSAPGSPSIIEAYNIQQSAVKASSEDGTILTTTGWEPNGGRFKNFLVVTFSPPQGIKSAKTITLNYDLKIDKFLRDLNAQNPSREARIAFRDQSFVLDDYAQIKGDALFFPFPPNKKVKAAFSLKTPEAWRTASNGLCPKYENGVFEWQAQPASDQLLPFETIASAYAISGKNLIEEKIGSSMILAGQSTSPGAEVTQVMAFETMKSRFKYFSDIFGPPPTTVPEKQPYQIFLTPYPTNVDKGAGGAYKNGATYIVYSQHDKKSFSTKGSHEFFHVYNSDALNAPTEVNSWFYEGYTDLQGLLAHEFIDLKTPNDRKSVYKEYMETAWKLTNDTGKKEFSTLEKLTFDEVKGPDYNPLIRGRAFLVNYRIGQIMGDHDKVDMWFKNLQKKYPRGGNSVLDYKGIKDAALASVGDDKEKSGKLKFFFEEYIEKNKPISKETLDAWLNDPATDKLLEGPRVGTRD